MTDLWKAIAQLAAELHPDRIASVADAIRGLDGVEEFDRARNAFGPQADQEHVDRLRTSWMGSPATGPAEIAAAFLAAAEAAAITAGSGAIELVWTGPKTGLIPARRTEQVLLEIIDSAAAELFLVTYVFYKATTVIKALDSVINRGVRVSVLLESSLEHGGTAKGDSVKTIAESIPGAIIYVWAAASREPHGDALSASVHAKCAVADRKLALITSANLTSAALERNMELGLLIRGGSVPEKLHAHLEALVATNVIERWR